MANYVIVRDTRLQDSAILSDHPPELDDEAFRFDSGVPLKDWVPVNAPYPMSPQWPDRRALYDFQSNTLSLLIVSRRCRDVLESGHHANIEFLPITLLDHRGKVANSSYFIANLQGAVDCMDLERSLFSPEPLEPSTFGSCSRLVLRDDRIPEDVELFRLSNGPTTYILKQSLKERLEAAGIQGSSFIPEYEYNSAFY